jgi:hypothetical protein
MDLTARAAELVADAIREALRPYLAEGLRGLSCIAPGADTIFAETVLGLGGELHVILPAADYRDRKVQPCTCQPLRPTYPALRGRPEPYPIGCAHRVSGVARGGRPGAVIRDSATDRLPATAVADPL